MSSIEETHPINVHLVLGSKNAPTRNAAAGATKAAHCRDEGDILEVDIESLMRGRGRPEALFTAAAVLTMFPRWYRCLRGRGGHKSGPSKAKTRNARILRFVNCTFGCSLLPEKQYLSLELERHLVRLLQTRGRNAPCQQ